MYDHNPGSIEICGHIEIFDERPKSLVNNDSEVVGRDVGPSPAHVLEGRWRGGRRFPTDKYTVWGPFIRSKTNET